MNEGDDYSHIKCIQHTHRDLLDKTWCGEQLTGFEFVFVGVDHAAENGRQDGRLVACPKCVDAVVKALRNGSEEETP